MKYFEFLKKRPNIIYLSVIIAAVLIAASVWQYRNLQAEKQAQIDLQNSMENYFASSGVAAADANTQDGTDAGGSDMPGVHEVLGTKAQVAKTTPVQPKVIATIPTATKPEVVKPKVADLKTMLTPVFGTLFLEFSDSKLLYSKTLDEWTTHQGIDIKADEGSQVRAVLDGTVSSLENDPQWGLSITINHGNGLATKYCSLSTLDLVALGQNLKKGEIISGVGKTAVNEILEDAHLHFEVLKDGKYLNPKAYLPNQALKR